MFGPKNGGVESLRFLKFLQDKPYHNNNVQRKNQEQFSSSSYILFTSNKPEMSEMADITNFAKIQYLQNGLSYRDGRPLILTRTCTFYLVFHIMYNVNPTEMAEFC